MSGPKRYAYSICLAFLFFAGCSHQWEITVENRNIAPCNFSVQTATGNAQGEAHVEGVATGKKLTLLAGEGTTTVTSIKVTRDNKEQTLEPKQPLSAGQTYVITVAPDGKIQTSVSGS